MTSTAPLPRRPFDSGAPAGLDPSAGPDARARHWYENDLGWPTVPAGPLRLLTGVRFDVLDVPAEAGAEALRHLAPGSPVALRGDRMELLVAVGGAEELPGLLDWLEWGPVPLDLRVLGAGDLLEAPVPPAGVVAVRPGSGGRESVRPESLRIESPPDSPRAESPRTDSRRVDSPRSESPPAPFPLAECPRAGSAQGAAVWLRPPRPGAEAEASLPAMPGVGREGSAPDLVRLVDTVAAQCHRVRLRRACAGHPAGRRNQPLAFS
ncbi:SCO3374 family protein [Streptomyces sp. NPDC015171]|uniref:SCO3374 family protein n=1 Tax=Streptomyces sp. NPDC015171 TaxID=3364945 RepID=UPI0036FD5F19